MNLVGHIRRLRWSSRMLLAVVVLAAAQAVIVPCTMAHSAAAQMGAMSGMSEHCTHCPPATGMSDIGSDCALRHAPAVDTYAASAHHLSTLCDSPLLQPATFGVSELRAVRTIFPPVKVIPAPSRPLNLTHCVQLK